MSRRTATDLDRMLAQGKPAGPELDQIWQGVHNQLTQDGALALQQPGWFARRWKQLGFALVPAVAAASLLVVFWPTTTSQSGFQARGTVSATPSIESSCGASDHPCRVGEEVFVRIVAGEHASTAVLVLEGSTATQILGSAQLKSGRDKVLPVKLRPELDDVANGIKLRLWFALDEKDAFLDGDAALLQHLRSANNAHSITRTLQVSTP